MGSETCIRGSRKRAISGAFQVFVQRNSFDAVEHPLSTEGDQWSRNAYYFAECIRLDKTGEESLICEQTYDLGPALDFLLLQAVSEASRIEDAEKN